MTAIQRWLFGWKPIGTERYIDTSWGLRSNRTLVYWRSRGGRLRTTNINGWWTDEMVGIEEEK